MSTEILAVPEEKLEEVIYVIRAGLDRTEGNFHKVSYETYKMLKEWCGDEEEYLLRVSKDWSAKE